MTMRRVGGFLVVLLLMHAGATTPANAQEPPGGQAQDPAMTRQEQVDRYVPWITASLGLAGSVWFYGYSGFVATGQDALFTADAATWEKLVIAAPSTAAFVVTSWFMAQWFERTICNRADTWWGAALWGAGLGTATGAAIATSGWFITLAMGDPMGVIDTGSVGATGYLAVLGMSIVSGAFWGGLSGVIPGAVIGPAIHLYVDS